MRCRKILLTALIALALMGLLWVGTVVASTAGPGFSDGKVDLWGVIQGIGTDSLVVNGLVVTVDAETEIKEGTEHLELSDLQVGWTVKVEGFFLADGTIVAEEIKVISRESVTPSPSPSITPTLTPTVTPTVTLTPTLTPTPTVTPTVTPTPEGAHPVGLALASFFGVPYDEIMAWHEGGIGFGNIVKAYFLADALEDEGLTVEDVLDEKLSGTGWGRLMKDLGLSPSSKDKNLGQVMSGHGDDEASDEDLTEADDHPGKGNGPPDKDKDKTPPGHDKGKAPPGLKKKDKDKGKSGGKP